MKLSTLATKICYSCTEQLNQSFEFYMQFQDSFSKLRSLMPENIPADQTNLTAEDINHETDVDMSCIVFEEDTASNFQEETVFVREESIIDKVIFEEIITENYTITYDKVDNTLTQAKICKGQLYENSRLVIPEFLPSTMNITTVPREVEQHIRTLDYKPVEVPIESKDTLTTFVQNTHLVSNNSIYNCQYCDQSYTNSMCLQTHQKRAHLCQYCTQAFPVTSDLRLHVRSVHQKHLCAICHKTFVNHGNLRAHLRRVHHLCLPPEVSLIDFIKQPYGTNQTPQPHKMLNPTIQSHGNTVLSNCVELSTKTSQDVSGAGPDNNPYIYCDANERNSLDKDNRNVQSVTINGDNVCLKVIEKEGQVMADLDFSKNQELLEMLYNVADGNNSDPYQLSN